MSLSLPRSPVAAFGAISLVGLVFLAPLVQAAPSKYQGPDAWPREIQTRKGTIVIYEPQAESLKGDQLKMRSAVSISQTGKAEPVFGAMWATARIRTDRNSGQVSFLSATVDRARFPDMTSEQEAKFKALVESEVPKWAMQMSMDRLRALLASAEREQKTAEALRNEAPRILVEKSLAVFVVIDGEPRLAPVEKTSLQRVVNTPFAILFDPAAGSWFISNGDFWYRAPAATGPYQPVKSPSSAVASAAAAVAKRQAASQEQPEAVESKLKTDKPPKLVVVTAAAELLSFDGEPSYVPVGTDNDLLYATNTEEKVLKEIASQKCWVLLSGRWFWAPSLEGPWTFSASDKLPESFSKIPPGAAIADVRPFVAGTDEAEDAVLDALIPQTSAIKRADANLEVTYDGDPKFEVIPNTKLAYAVNASTQVLLSSPEGDYYACDQGVWYISETPKGPWRVSTERPPGIDGVPPSSAAYNTKYAYIYDSNEDDVTVGYTPGYLGSYVAGPTVVYGTGWDYPSWVGAMYYPSPWTWGFGASFTPWFGWGFGWGYASGFYGYGWGWGRHHGGYWGGHGHGHHGCYGPGGYRPPHYGPGYRPGHNPPPAVHGGGRPGYGGHPGAPRPGQGGLVRTGGSGSSSYSGSNNLYARSENRVRNAPDRGVPTTSTRPSLGRPERPGQSREVRPGSTREAPRQPSVSRSRPNDVYADRDGNVVRRDQSGWKTRDGKGWSGTNARPSPGIERDYTARQRASERSGGSTYRPAPQGRSAPQGRPSYGSGPRYSPGPSSGSSSGHSSGHSSGPAPSRPSGPSGPSGGSSHSGGGGRPR